MIRSLLQSSLCAMVFAFAWSAAADAQDHIGSDQAKGVGVKCINVAGDLGLEDFVPDQCVRNRNNGTMEDGGDADFRSWLCHFMHDFLPDAWEFFGYRNHGDCVSDRRFR